MKSYKSVQIRARKCVLVIIGDRGMSEMCMERQGANFAVYGRGYDDIYLGNLSNCLHFMNQPDNIVDCDQRVLRVEQNTALPHFFRFVVEVQGI